MSRAADATLKDLSCLASSAQIPIYVRQDVSYDKIQYVTRTSKLSSCGSCKPNDHPRHIRSSYYTSPREQDNVWGVCVGREPRPAGRVVRANLCRNCLGGQNLEFGSEFATSNKQHGELHRIIFDKI